MSCACNAMERITDIQFEHSIYSLIAYSGGNELLNLIFIKMEKEELIDFMNWLINENLVLKQSTVNDIVDSYLSINSDAPLGAEVISPL